MRLWHYKLIPFLPKSQLIAQWRELNSIFKKQDKHILINYVYEYDKSHLLAYSMLVMSEMYKRGYKINSSKNFDDYFKDTRLIAIGDLENFKPFPLHHDKRYLKQCFYNLQEKYDRGQKDFSKQQYNALLKFCRSFDYGKDIQ